MATATLTAAAPYIIQQITLPTRRSSTASGRSLSAASCLSSKSTPRKNIFRALRSSACSATTCPISPRSRAVLAPHRLELHASQRLPARARLLLRCWPTGSFPPQRAALRESSSTRHQTFSHDGLPPCAHACAQGFGDFLEHYGRVCAAISDQETSRNWAGSSGIQWSSASSVRTAKSRCTVAVSSAPMVMPATS